MQQLLTISFHKDLHTQNEPNQSVQGNKNLEKKKIQNAQQALLIIAVILRLPHI